MTSAGGEAPSVPLDPDIELGGNERQPEGPRRRRARRVQGAMVLAVGCGGVFGALCRYSLSLALPTEPGRFPWGTFIINISGSVVLGFLLIMVIEQFPRGRLARPVIGTGICGAYTTFSTYMVDAVSLVHDGHPLTALVYVVASLGAGLAAAWAGMAGARLVVRAERWLQDEL